MTAAEFCRSGMSVSAPVMPQLSAQPVRNWLVRFRYSLSGEPPQIAQETALACASEAGAIKAAITRRLGRVNRALRSLEMLEVRPIE